MRSRGNIERQRARTGAINERIRQLVAQGSGKAGSKRSAVKFLPETVIEKLPFNERINFQTASPGMIVHVPSLKKAFRATRPGGSRLIRFVEVDIGTLRTGK